MKFILFCPNILVWFLFMQNTAIGCQVTKILYSLDSMWIENTVHTSAGSNIVDIMYPKTEVQLSLLQNVYILGKMCICWKCIRFFICGYHSNHWMYMEGLYGHRWIATDILYMVIYFFWFHFQDIIWSVETRIIVTESHFWQICNFFKPIILCDLWVCIIRILIIFPIFPICGST
jgi:hypothetical protein